LARLDARHDELLTRLDDLNHQIEAALAECTRARCESLQVNQPETVEG
jgi:hypothetical protein